MYRQIAYAVRIAKNEPPACVWVRGCRFEEGEVVGQEDEEGGEGGEGGDDEGEGDLGSMHLFRRLA